jgi:hypothetical protein
MIRPITFLCASAFVFSGFHLYQTKQRSQDVDHQIVRTMKAVDAAHNHAVLLRAEYALLNDPTRLQDLAQQYLVLRPTAPTQFVALADLGRRLPPVGPSPNAAPPVVETPPVGAPAISDIPMASATPAAPATEPVPAPAPAEMVATVVPPHEVAPPRPAPARPAPPAAVVAAAAAPATLQPATLQPATLQMDGVVHSVSLVRPLPRRSEPAAPTPLHAVRPQGAQRPYVAPSRLEPIRPAVERRDPPRTPGYAPVYARTDAPTYARPQYAPPSYSGTPFAEPRYGATPARPMVASALGMARTMDTYPTGGGR